jgi:hypothetical protein
MNAVRERAYRRSQGVRSRGIRNRSEVSDAPVGPSHGYLAQISHDRFTENQEHGLGCRRKAGVSGGRRTDQPCV